MDHLPYGKHSITEADIDAVNKVLTSQWLTQGPCVPEFEKQVCEKTKGIYSVATNSATSALHLACLALGVGTDDIVWTSPITFVASANCAKYCGAAVDFVDIELATGLMSGDALEQKLEEASLEGRLPKVVIPVHLSGASCDMRRIKSLSDRFGFKIIEDASHAIGGVYKDAIVGSCKYSDITVFSFHPVKIITTGEGGVATSNDEDLAERMRELRSHGITKDKERFRDTTQAGFYYEQQCLGYNYRMTDIQAALGSSQIGRLEEIVRKRREIYDAYKELTIDIDVEMLEIPNDVKSSCHLAICMLGSNSKDKHKQIFEGLRASGIGVQLHYYPVHLQPYYKNPLTSYGNLGNAETYAVKAISLPIFPELTKDMQEVVVARLASLI